MENPIPFNPATLSAAELIQIAESMRTLFQAIQDASGDDERIAGAALDAYHTAKRRAAKR
jgi:hypothetical protein